MNRSERCWTSLVRISASEKAENARRLDKITPTNVSRYSEWGGVGQKRENQKDALTHLIHMHEHFSEVREHVGEAGYARHWP